jgi:hypothetical protein
MSGAGKCSISPNPPHIFLSQIFGVSLLLVKKFKYKKTSIHCWNMDIVVYRLYRRSWFWFYIPSHLTFETEEEAITFCNNMNSGVI